MSNGAQLYDVKNYGAYGDGSHDDTVSINNAMSAAAAANGTVYFPDGVYLVSDSLNFSFTGTAAIRGNSQHTAIILQTGSGKTALFVTSREALPKKTALRCAILDFELTLA